MANACYRNEQRKRKTKRSINAPFGMLIPSSLRDPTDATFKTEHLEKLKDVDDARDVALRFLHDHEVFANVWKSKTLHPNTRRLMRKLVQIQTINAIGNR